MGKTLYEILLGPLYFLGEIGVLKILERILQSHGYLILGFSKGLLPFFVGLGLRKENVIHFGDVLLPVPDQSGMLVNDSNILGSQLVLFQNRKQILVAAVRYGSKLVVIPLLAEYVLDVALAHTATCYH